MEERTDVNVADIHYYSNFKFVVVVVSEPKALSCRPLYYNLGTTICIKPDKQDQKLLVVGQL